MSTKYTPRSPRYLYSHERVDRSLDRRAEQLEHVLKLDPMHPFRRKYDAIYEATATNLVVLERLGSRLEAECGQPSEHTTIGNMEEHHYWMERSGEGWRSGTIKMSLLARMCRDAERGRTPDEIHDDAQKLLRTQAEIYDDLERPLSYLPHPFVDSDSYHQIGNLISNTVKQAQAFDHGGPN